MSGTGITVCVSSHASKSSFTRFSTGEKYNIPFLVTDDASQAGDGNESM